MSEKRHLFAAGTHSLKLDNEVMNLVDVDSYNRVHGT